MKISQNALTLLAVRTFKGIGPDWIYRHLDRLVGKDASDAGILDCLEKKTPDMTIDDLDSARECVRRQIDALGGSIDGVVGVGDSDFPYIREGVKNADRPIALFYKGNLELLSDSSRNVAVVGLLNPDETIAADETRVVEELVRRGHRIVSGLALGCDSVAHRVALERHGDTIAVLPSPLNEIIPEANCHLAAKIVEQGGLLVSEYLTKPSSPRELVSRYIERDRLQAMFTRCVVLAASYAPNKLGNDCGSRHAMGKAAEYGIPRAVIYNEVHAEANPMYDLNRVAFSGADTDKKLCAMKIDPLGGMDFQLPSILEQGGLGLI